MEDSTVSVICLCHNQAQFVGAALNSVLRQTHSRVEIVVVDDASTDNSSQVIQTFCQTNPGITFLPLTENVGICKAFNKGLALTSGSFLIDLAADDELLPTRIVAGLSAFRSSGPDYGVNFTDAELVDESGLSLGFHSDRFPHSSIPEGDIYKELIVRYFINSPSMMFRRAVLEKMGGYDERLTYEDFDFWIRSSREWKYVYTPEVMVRRRILTGSMARNQYKRGSPQLESTFRVCEKITKLNRTRDEHKALRRRVFYEMRRAAGLGEFGLVRQYIGLWMASN